MRKFMMAVEAVDSSGDIHRGNVWFQCDRLNKESIQTAMFTHMQWLDREKQIRVNISNMFCTFITELE